MPDLGEEVTFDGTVTAEGAHAVFVDARLLVAGAADQRLRDHRTKFVLRTEAGQKITVTFAAGASVLPERDVHGPWREITQHPTHPTGDFPPDGFVQLRGSWLVPGERVRLIGRVTASDFVPDTGGEREAPALCVTALEAIAIVVETTTSQLPGPAPSRRRRWTLAMVVTTAVLIGLELILRL